MRRYYRIGSLALVQRARTIDAMNEAIAPTQNTGRITHHHALLLPAAVCLTLLLCLPVNLVLDLQASQVTTPKRQQLSMAPWPRLWRHRRSAAHLLQPLLHIPR